MKIYTRGGDRGETGLLGGHRVSKSHVVVAALGSLDELNCTLGLVLGGELPAALRELLEPIQHDLFALGSQVADACGQTGRVGRLPPARVEQLEQAIDQLDADLPPLRTFILPGGAPAGSHLHLARAVARRAERELVACVETLNLEDWGTELALLNRLADLLFVAARWANRQAGVSETAWHPDRSPGADP